LICAERADVAVELEHGECDTEIGSAAANRLLDVVAVTEAVLEVCQETSKLALIAANQTD
jgi:hypothetical protein